MSEMPRFSSRNYFTIAAASTASACAAEPCGRGLVKIHSRIHIFFVGKKYATGRHQEAIPQSFVGGQIAGRWFSDDVGVGKDKG